uniref:Mos1 transposase HTH domain-containing protein n=1 Tax=Globodera rostochiensis TaxID=31243 RepID=A0A914HSH7_GLORO
MKEITSNEKRKLIDKFVAIKDEFKQNGKFPYPQVDKNEHFRHLLLFEFNKGTKASEAAQNICAVYGEDAIAERTARKWFVRFREGVFDLKNTPHTGRRSAFDEERLKSVWWDMEGVVHYEMLGRNETVNAELYCQQLRRLDQALQQKRPNRAHRVILQHDNARPHTANMTKMALQELGWEVLPHPPYSPDVAPSDYHRFRSLSNALSGATLENAATLRNWLDQFFASKPPIFYKRGIENCLCGGRRSLIMRGNT